MIKRTETRFSRKTNYSGVFRVADLKSAVRLRKSLHSKWRIKKVKNMVKTNKNGKKK